MIVSPGDTRLEIVRIAALLAVARLVERMVEATALEAATRRAAELETVIAIPMLLVITPPAV